MTAFMSKLGRRVYVEKWADRNKPVKQSPRVGSWSDVEIEFLVAACKTTKSFGVIAREFNRTFPTNCKTRNAIIGKCQREGLSDEKPGSTGQAARAVRRMSRNRVIKAIPAKPARLKVTKKDLAPVVFKPALRDDNEPILRQSGPHTMKRKTPEQIAQARKGHLPCIVEEAPLTSVAMEQTAADCCKWPTSEDVLCMEVCGEPAEYGAYCERHARVAYREMPTKRRNTNYARKGMLEDQSRIKQRDARILEEMVLDDVEAPAMSDDTARLLLEFKS